MSFQKNIEVISSRSSEGLRRKLSRVTVPYGISYMYSDSKLHYAWIRPDRPFSEKTRKKMNEELIVNNNG